MPLIKIDYNEKIIDTEAIKILVEELLKESMRVYSTDVDKVSIFTSPFGENFASTAAAEIEVRAKLSEYERPNKSKDELRQEHMREYYTFLKNFIAKHQIQRGIVFTITFEDWQVIWLEGSSSTSAD